jgi:hypothetical protein
MAKTLLKIRVHSFVDTITNSSSELFVMKENKDVDVLREALREIWEGFKKIKGDDELYENEDELEDILTVEIANKSDVKYWKSQEKDWNYKFDVKEGDILIKSTSDNTIPYGIQTIIENDFNATRFHLG